jgi:hypothetical protein
MAADAARGYSKVLAFWFKALEGTATYEETIYGIQSEPAFHNLSFCESNPHSVSISFAGLLRLRAATQPTRPRDSTRARDPARPNESRDRGCPEPCRPHRP